MGIYSTQKKAACKNVSTHWLQPNENCVCIFDRLHGNPATAKVNLLEKQRILAILKSFLPLHTIPKSFTKTFAHERLAQ